MQGELRIKSFIEHWRGQLSAREPQFSSQAGRYAEAEKRPGRHPGFRISLTKVDERRRTNDSHWQSATAATWLTPLRSGFDTSKQGRLAEAEVEARQALLDV